jgi:prolyl oligopeptidase PreP (S9A serine peptidase family)
MDMLCFHKFTIGWAWVSDYGRSDKPDEFKTLYAYSPYHNLKPGTKYLPMLVTTGDYDDHAVPRHSFKFAARLPSLGGTYSSEVLFTNSSTSSILANAIAVTVSAPP